jgi:hypothetical protein
MNKVGADGARAVSKLYHLKCLNMNIITDADNNDIGNEGAFHISAIKELTTLRLEQNKIDADGVYHIA